MSEHVPAYLKFTPAVEKGVRYAIAMLDVDSTFQLIDTEKGGPLAGTTSPDDLAAARDWLRYTLNKKLSEARRSAVE